MKTYTVIELELLKREYLATLDDTYARTHNWTDRVVHREGIDGFLIWLNKREQMQ
jgi:hypothetical protein